jgi:hypothetical protein
MKVIDVTNARVGCPTNDDRRAAQGLLSPDFGAEEVVTNNRAAVEMTLLWKSQNDFHRSLEISHTRDSHIPTSRFLFLSDEKT